MTESFMHFSVTDGCLFLFEFVIENIEDLLLPYKFDLSLFHNISDPDAIDHIRRIGVLFYKKE